ncbi:MAG TPA: SRPBCC domain-containing protein [Caulobacteraceae bacterium]|nr:SRPBCC domain-containing protein [Caulobacteraceae bacterium]
MSHATRADWRKTPQGARLDVIRRFRQPADKVWAALTTPERLAAWMGIEWLGEAGPLRVGAPFDYRFANTDLESRGRVLVLDPPRVLEHSWFENIPPAAVVRWALEPDGEGCVLTLTHSAGPPEDAPRTAAGWTQLLESLAASLGEPDSAAGGGMDAWRARRDHYAATFPPEALRDGRRVEVDGHPALRFERRLRKPGAAVWSALVEPEALKRWLQAEATIDPHAGGRFHLILGGGASPMAGKILRWDPPRLLEYTWPEAAAGAASVVRFEVFDDGPGSRLVLTHILPDGGDLADFASGWHWHLDALERALEGEAVAFDRPRWSALKRAYAATL